MEALNASYRLVSASIVVVLGAVALLVTFINAVFAVDFIETRAGWLTGLTAYAFIYLALAVVVPATAAYRSRRSGQSRSELARRVVFASLALNLLVLPWNVAALAM
jgi:NADH:ubiquinone oxidoreductase subunit 6 (subunit J)